MAGCVFGYFADVYCSNGIVSPNCSTAFVIKCPRQNDEVHVMGIGFVQIYGLG